MPEEVRVTPSEVRAAQRIVERDAANGKETSEAIRKIAETEPPADQANARAGREPVSLKSGARQGGGRPTKRALRSDRVREVLRRTKRNEAEHDLGVSADHEPG